MAFTHTLAWSCATSGDAVNSQLAATAQSETRMDVDIPADTAGLGLTCPLDISRCKGFFMVADAAMSVAFDSETPIEFLLAANAPIAWVDGAGSCPISSDVIAIYVTSAAGGTIKIRSLVDPTGE